jgi:hypothetical protein
MSRTWLGLLLLAALAAGGAWNYQRNLVLETGARPFSGYSDGQLDALAAGYQGEVDALSDRYVRQQGRSAATGGGRLIDENIAAFDAAHAHGAATRRIGGDLSQREAELADLRAELAHRSRDRWRVFLERLLTI